MHSLLCKLIFIITISIISAQKSSKIKVGIIGGGLGGTFTAYELLKSHENFEIDLYDKKSKEGGRLLTEKKDGILLDMGGSYFLEGQEFIESLLKDLNIKATSVDKKTSMGIFSENNIIYQMSDSKIMNFLRAFWRYGLSSISSKKIIDIQHDHFKRIYKHLQNKEYFSNIGELLTNIGCEDLIALNLEEYLNPVLGQKYIDKIINSQVLSIYMQDAKSINAFTGMFALDNFNKPYKAIENGSYEVVHKLLGRLEYNKNFKFFKNHNVIEINRDKDIYKVVTENGDTIEYDIVILATPLYLNNKIQFTGNFKFEDESRLYFTPVSSEVLYVKGDISKSYFNMAENSVLPDSLSSSNPELTDYVVNVDHVKDDVYKIRGNNLLPKIEKMFRKNYEVLKLKKWDFQCPKFRPFKRIDELPDFIVEDNLYYLNSIESIADGMEISLISAHNVVNIIDNKMKKLLSENSKDEF